MDNILSFIASFVIDIIQKTGYFGISFLMALESANIPIPSEVIMPFSGYLAFLGKFSFWLVVLAGSVGNLLGSVAGYIIGYFGGRPFVEKYGKYFFIEKSDLEKADSWFRKYGQKIVLLSRLLPVVRTFISTPAGIARMNFKKFCAFTFLGSLPWSLFLAYLGFKAGENWEFLGAYFKKFDWLIVALIGLGVIWFIYKKLKHR